MPVAPAHSCDSRRSTGEKQKDAGIRNPAGPSRPDPARRALHPRAMGARRGTRHLPPDLRPDVGSGHNIVATCFEECREMYRAEGPQELKSLGETEFVNGIAAMSAAGKYGPARCCAGIIGNVDLRIGSRAQGILEQIGT